MSPLLEFCRCCLTQIMQTSKIFINFLESNLMNYEYKLLPIGKQLYLLCPELDLQINSKQILCANCYQIITTLNTFMCQYNKNTESTSKHQAYVFNFDQYMSSFGSSITDVDTIKSEEVCLYDCKDPYIEIQDEAIYGNNYNSIISEQKLKFYYNNGSAEKSAVIANTCIHDAEASCTLSIEDSEQCDYSSSQKHNLINQIREKLFKRSQSADSKKKHLQRQILIHIEEKPFKCTQCDYCTQNKSNLKRHMYNHSGDKPFKCSLCIYSSADKGNFKSHISVHTGEKPFQCTLCDYRGRNNAHLRSHMSVHTKNKPFKCSQCNYKTSNNANLKSHLRIHSGEKPFKCLQCDYCSCKKSHLRRHMFIHIGEKPFKCFQCNFSFSRKDQLKKHIFIHLKNQKIEKSFKCFQCNFSFSQKGQLKQHISFHTKNRRI